MTFVQRFPVSSARRARPPWNAKTARSDDKLRSAITAAGAELLIEATQRNAQAAAVKFTSEISDPKDAAIEAAWLEYFFARSGSKPRPAYPPLPDGNAGKR